MGLKNAHNSWEAAKAFPSCLATTAAAEAMATAWWEETRVWFPPLLASCFPKAVKDRQRPPPLSERHWGAEKGLSRDV